MSNVFFIVGLVICFILKRAELVLKRDVEVITHDYCRRLSVFQSKRKEGEPPSNHSHNFLKIMNDLCLLAHFVICLLKNSTASDGREKNL